MAAAWILPHDVKRVGVLALVAVIGIGTFGCVTRGNGLQGISGRSPASSVTELQQALCRRGFSSNSLREVDGVVYLDLRRSSISDLAFLGEDIVIGGLDLAHVEELRSLAHCSLRHGIKYIFLDHSTVMDLPDLEGQEMNFLSAEFSMLADLSGLVGCRVLRVFLRESWVTDLSPLNQAGMVLLDVAKTGVVDLSPLRGNPIRQLDLQETGVIDLSPLRGMPLVSLNISGTPVRDLSPLVGMNIKALNMRDVLATDLSILKDMPLESLDFTMTRIRKGLEVLGHIPSLTEVNGEDAESFLQFWMPIWSDRGHPESAD